MATIVDTAEQAYKDLQADLARVYDPAKKTVRIKEMDVPLWTSAQGSGMVPDWLKNVPTIGAIAESMASAVTWLNNILGLYPSELERQIQGSRSTWASDEELQAWRAWVHQNWPGIELSGDIWDEPFYSAWVRWTTFQREVHKYADVYLPLDGGAVNVVGNGTLTPTGEQLQAFVALNDASRNAYNDAHSKAKQVGDAGMVGDVAQGVTGATLVLVGLMGAVLYMMMGVKKGRKQQKKAKKWKGFSKAF